MKRKNKQYITIILILVIGSLSFFLLIGINLRNNQKKENPTIALEENTLFEYENKKWKKKDPSTYDWRRFHIYTNKEYLGKYYLVNNEKWYLFDDEKKAVNYEGDLLALDTDHKYVVTTTEPKEIENPTEDPYIRKVLKENNLKEDSLMTSNFYLDIDIDSDKIEEKIYIISNKFPTEPLKGTSFGFVFMVKDEKINMIYQHVDKSEDLFDGCKPYVNYAIDMDQDHQNEIFVGCSYYSNNGVENYIYKWNNGAFKLLVSSK